ncbi:MAG: type VI secretion system ATPase TssH [Myxococcales bacterium]|nr:type VI secretion system ATPase TssH [Myxococcales bacterium]
MLVEPKAIIKRLTRTCTAALESAVVQCVNVRHYEVTVEHVLSALLENPDSDVAFLTMHYDLDPGALKSTLQRSLDSLRTGNSGKPNFSPALLDWMQDAFTVGAMEYGYGRIRSGMLFARVIEQGSKYSTSGIGMQLGGVPKDELKKNFAKIVSGSKEDADAGSLAGGAVGGEGGKLPKGSSLDAESALARFCIDFTGKARSGDIDPVFGREREIRNMVDILARRRKNSPIVIGEAGVGKTALIEGLALKIVNNDVPELLKGVEILGLDLGLLQAGASVKGEFEKRLKGVIDEVKSSSKPIIIFIDEAHLLIGGGGGGGADAANLLKPALARGELRTIAATTYSEYKKHIEKDAALERRFQPVRVEEPSESVCVTMLRGLREKFETAHNIIIQDEAIEAAVRLSARYITGRQLPDKAVDLLDTCAARVRVSLQQKPADVEDCEVLIANLTRELAALDRDEKAGITCDRSRMEDLGVRIAQANVNLIKLGENYAKELACVQKVIDARVKMNAATGEDEKAKLREAVKAAISEMKAAQGEVPLIRPDVDEAMVAAVVAAWTGVPVGKMVADDVVALVNMEKHLIERIKGQDWGITAISKELRSARAGLKAAEQPLGVFLLVGPSGVGKTETALGIADLMFGGERMMVTINMSEFQEKHTVSRLIGSPPGYVGYGEGGMLTEAVRHRPYTVVLLDECEKADPDVLNLFYQVFDKGMLSDGEGRLIDFKNTVIIMTSNLATDKITNTVVAAWEDGETPNVQEILETIKPTLSSHFKPALLARMTVVPYLPIAPEAMAMISRLKLNKLMQRLNATQNITATYTEKVITLITSRCTEVDTGARNIDHILRATLIPQLSSSILAEMAAGRVIDKLALDVDGGNEFATTFTYAAE